MATIIGYYVLENVSFLFPSLTLFECGNGFPALINVWIALAGVLKWFTSTNGKAQGFMMTCDMQSGQNFPKLI